MSHRELLKKDLFGEIWRIEDRGNARILRDCSSARWWAAPLARWLLRREATALAALDGQDRVPQVLARNRHQLERSWLAGRPLYQGGAPSTDYFRHAMRLLRRLHTAGVAHNDLAKEPNILVLDDDQPAFIDFQLASHAPNRGALFRLLAREDLRHLLKHKRTYAAGALTARERRILDNPGTLSRLWMAAVKPAYLFLTRRILNWSDREGAADRGRSDNG